MPFGDGTGPLGRGPRTGRGAGFCAGFGAPGSFNNWGAGLSRGGRGGGRGWRNRPFGPGFPAWQGAFGQPFGSPYAAPGRDEEIGALKAQAGFFERALDEIRKRIESLETKPKPE
ncbi:MAG TPA: DUF5320 domain-containing protein [Terriglobales bacterium]|nr:DUF5320 domain-containing protein [Terriglobales bacterium]